MSIGSVEARVMTAMGGVGAPCENTTYSGNAKTYFTFFVVVQWNTAHGDGKPLASGYRVQLDGWSNDGEPDMNELNETAKTRLKEAGFSFVSARNLHEDKTKTKHRIQEFYFYEEG